jgi:hypothetical protein
MAAGHKKERPVGRWLRLRPRTKNQKVHCPGNVMEAVFNGR